jgi:ribonucleoside-diphosphate reductase beta chain
MTPPVLDFDAPAVAEAPSSPRSPQTATPAQATAPAHGKRLLNCSATDPNKILPIAYPWARQFYKTGVNNNWTPEEVPMQDDIELWKRSGPNGLSDAERHLLLRNLGFFSTAESLTANNIILGAYKHITNPECRQYMLRQAYEEAIHTDTFIYCCDSLGLDPDEVYAAYESIPSIKAKDDFVVDITKSILDPNFATDSPENIQKFLHDVVGYWVIMEGLFFYAGFAMMLSFKRVNKMIGVAEQFQYILRDESVHLAFGTELVNGIVAENPEVWTPEFQQTLVGNIRRAVELEEAYVDDCLPAGGIFGLRAEAVKQYVRYIADRRMERINLPKQYGVENPFDWMSEIMDLRKEKNFFETRVTEYQGGGALEW